MLFLKRSSTSYGLFCLRIIFLLACLIFWDVFRVGGDAISEAANLSQFNPKIVIDPGHGGPDNGAQSPSGLYEKTVTLELARLIAEKLGKQYHIILTRTDDYAVDVFDRSMTANQAEPRVFVSLHASGSYQPKTNGITIIYYTSTYQSSSERPSTYNPPIKADPEIRLWNLTYRPHLLKSHRLAQILSQSIAGHQEKSTVMVVGLPVLVLSGVDAPAVLVEIGYLTNPQEDNLLQSRDHLKKISAGICEGIVSFLESD
jgi:N-acetylmuramoyl-L-alanine amidase